VRNQGTNELRRWIVSNCTSNSAIDLGRSVNPMRSCDHSRCKHTSHIGKLGKRNPPPQKSLHFLSIRSLLDVFEMSSQKHKNKCNLTIAMSSQNLRNHKPQCNLAMQPGKKLLEQQNWNFLDHTNEGSLAHALHNVGQLKRNQKEKGCSKTHIP
jgi:hypothetical protein